MSKASCLEYVGGSHKWGRWFIPKKFATLNNYKYTDQNSENTNKAFEDIPDIDAHPEKYQLFAWELEVMTNIKQGVCLAVRTLKSYSIRIHHFNCNRYGLTGSTFPHSQEHFSNHFFVVHVTPGYSPYVSYSYTK